MLATKLRYEAVFLQVEKLYNKEFDLLDTQGINEHCDFIREFIESCGWSVDDYIRAMFGFDTSSKKVN